MTLEEFQRRFKKHKRFDRLWYYGLCFAIIAFSIYMLYSGTTDTNIEITGNNTFHYISFGFLLLFGVYGLVVLRKTYQLTYWENGLTKAENINLFKSTCADLVKADIELDGNSTYFVYKKSWWRMPYEVHIFADNNLIAINVEGLDKYDGGFIDFGASKRLQNKILALMKEKASR